MIKPEDILPFYVTVPLFGAFLNSLIAKRIKPLPDILGNLTTAALFCLSLVGVYLFNVYGVLNYFVGGWKPPIGINMVLDGFSAFMLVTVNLVALCVSVYSVNYMEKFTAKWKFYTLFLLMLTGMNGVIITGDIFNLYVYLEIASIASYVLVAFGTEKHELEAAFKYAIMGIVASVFILIGIVFLYSFTSTLNMADMANILQTKGKADIILFVSVLFIMGFGLKAALVPFHGWLPDAHPSAPAPISAMLSGVLIKTLGIYALCRVFFNVLGITPMVSNILLFLGVLSMVVGGCLALIQQDLKRLLAYSSISQIGYIILGIGLGTPLGIFAGLFHLFNHSVFKSLLFLNSGSIEYSVGTRDLGKMGGLAKVMPVTSTTNLFASMSVAGVPPFAGFWSKLLIIIAVVQAQRYGYAFWAVLVSILTLAMYLKISRYAFYGNLDKAYEKIKEVPAFMKISVVVLSIICLLGGVLFIKDIQNVFLKNAASVLSNGKQYAASVFKELRK